MKRKRIIYSLLFILSTLLLFLPIFFKIKFEDFKTFGLIGILIINFLGSATIFIPTPSIISVGIGGHLYNPILVALFASVGSSLGESIAFLFGLSSKELFDFKKHKFFYHFLDFVFRKYGNVAVILFSFIPNPFFDGIGIFVGLTSYSLKRFLILVFIGRFLRNLLVASGGAMI